MTPASLPPRVVREDGDLAAGRDAAWFRANPGESMRLRPPYPGEIEAMARPRPGVTVQQTLLARAVLYLDGPGAGSAMTLHVLSALLRDRDATARIPVLASPAGLPLRFLSAEGRVLDAVSWIAGVLVGGAAGADRWVGVEWLGSPEDLRRSPLAASLFGPETDPAILVPATDEIAALPRSVVVRAGPNFHAPSFHSTHTINLLEHWRAMHAMLRVPPHPVTQDNIGMVQLQRILGELGAFAPGAIDCTEIDLLELAHWQACWGQVGRPNFDLTQSLAATLVLTDCDTVLSEDVCWPFDSVMVTLPHPGSPIRFTAMDGQTEIDGRWLLVHRYEQPEEREHSVELTALMQRVYDSRTLAEGAQRLEDYRRRWAEVPKASMGAVRILSDTGCSIFWRGRLPGPGERMSSWLACKGPEGYKSPHNARDQHALRLANRLATNLFLYIAERRESGAWKEPRGRDAEDGHNGRSRPAHKPPKPHTYQLGSEIHLPREMLELARMRSDRVRCRAAWRLAARFCVTGHWRMQACGPKRADRKRIRIAPFWKGPDASRILGHVYTVAAPAEKAGRERHARDARDDLRERLAEE
jgi:hypothetical protein